MIVLDASVVVKLVIGSEPGNDAATKLLDKHVRGSQKIAVPNFLFVEVANMMATKSDFLESEIERSLSFLYKLEFQVENVDMDILVEAAILAKKNRLAVYDMLYAVLAKKLKTELVTADENFVKKSGFSWVKILS